MCPNNPKYVYGHILEENPRPLLALLLLTNGVGFSRGTKLLLLPLLAAGILLAVPPTTTVCCCCWEGVPYTPPGRNEKPPAAPSEKEASPLAELLPLLLVVELLLPLIPLLFIILFTELPLLLSALRNAAVDTTFPVADDELIPEIVSP
jgi:hypothetical protein